MRFVLALLAGLIWTPAAHAQNARIERIQVVGTGIIEVGSKVKNIKDKEIITGTRSEATTSKIVQNTTEIPAKTGTIFGVDFRMIGIPKGKRAKIRIMWRYPEPGLKNPKGTVTTIDAYDDVFTSLAEPNTVYWSLADDWTLVPGKWTVELWQDKRRLMNVEFTLVK